MNINKKIFITIINIKINLKLVKVSNIKNQNQVIQNFYNLI